MRKVILGTALAFLALGATAYASMAADKGAPATFEQILAMRDAPARPVSCHLLAGAGFAVARSAVGDVSSTLPIAGAGTIGSLGAGCDYRMGRASIGVFGGYDVGTVKARIVDAGGSGGIGITNMSTIGARLGWYVQPTTLLYGSAGYAMAKTEIGETTERGLKGLQLGAGLETKIGGPVWFRFNGEWTRFNRENFDAARYEASLVTTKASIVLKW